MQKDLNIVSPEGLRAAVPDVELHGDPNLWICIAKASSKSKGWMHSTKVALIRGQGLLIQTSTELADIGSYAHRTSQALQFIPGVFLEGRTVEGKPVYEIVASHCGDRTAGTFYMDGVRVGVKPERAEVKS